MMKHGLLPIKYKDHRTLDFHRTFGTTPAILERFNSDTLGLKPDQNADGLPEACTAYTHNDIASNEDGVAYDDYDFTYRNTLRVMGAEYGEPCDIMKALKATTVYGVKNKQMNPADALLHRRAPYFIVRPLGDYFEGLISAMKVKQGCLSLGTPWFPSFEFPDANGLVPSPNDWTNLFRATWHDWEACGVEIINGEPYIISKSWQGAQYGKSGYVHFSREQINKLLSIKGSGAFGQKVASPEDIKAVEMDLLETAISYLRMWLEKVLKVVNPPIPVQIPNPTPIPLPEPLQEATEPVSTLLWDTKENVRHSVRVMCDEAGMSVSDKNILCACVEQESGFNPKAIGTLNENGTQDFGLCQYNNGHNAFGVPFWIGTGADFEDVEEVLSDTEKNVRVMIREFKAGHQNYWASFSSGAYKQHLH